MDKKRISEIEQKVITYCQQRNIPITNGKIPEQYKAEVIDFVKQQIKQKKRQIDEFNKVSISPPLKDLLKGG